MAKNQLQTLEFINEVSSRIDTSRHKVIAILGLPATGKSCLSHMLWQDMRTMNRVTYSVHHGDDYLKVKGTIHPAALFERAIISDTCEWKIFEGCQAITVLLLEQIKPDLIIECVADRQTRFKRRDKDTPTFDKRLKQAWARYLGTNPGIEIWTHDTSINDKPNTL